MSPAVRAWLEAYNRMSPDEKDHRAARARTPPDSAADEGSQAFKRP
jgi:hypothetical protein